MELQNRTMLNASLSDQFGGDDYKHHRNRDAQSHDDKTAAT